MTADPYAQHQAILAAARALLAEIRRSPQISMGDLGRLRARLSALIREHRKTEEETIFAPLFGQGGIERMPQLKAALQQNKEEKSRYSDIVRRWTPEAIQADWAGYVAAVAERVDQLAWMIRFEEERIYRPIFDLLGRDPDSKAATR